MARALLSPADHADPTRIPLEAPLLVRLLSIAPGCAEQTDSALSDSDGGTSDAQSDTQLEVGQTEQPLLGSAAKSIPAITQRNAIMTQPFAPQLLTPDGRLGLFWSEGNTKINVIALAHLG